MRVCFFYASGLLALLALVLLADPLRSILSLVSPEYSHVLGVLGVGVVGKYPPDIFFEKLR